LMLTLTLAPAVAEEPEVLVPAELQARIFVNALTFDRNLPARAHGRLLLAVLIQRKVRPSIEAGEEFLGAVARLPADIFPGLSVRAVRVDFTSADDLAGSLDATAPSVAYVTPLRAMGVEELSALTRRRQIRTVTGVANYVAKGLTLGVRLRGERPEILVNLAAARAEGADFNSQLLKLARVIE
jgi:YfiR/HmsC-like